jgi:3-hydroxyacyl-[acyl-carrier-protein] dehydratase
VNDAPSGDPLEALPHGPGFRFLDSVSSLVPGRSGVATYRVHGAEPFLAGHFPGRPIVPGVILIEAVAQLAGVVAQSDPTIAPLDDLRLSAVRSAKIFGTAGPGTVLEISAEIAGRLGPLVQATGSITADGTTLLTTQITLSGRA